MHSPLLLVVWTSSCIAGLIPARITTTPPRMTSIAYVAKYDDLNSNYRFAGTSNRQAPGTPIQQPYKELVYDNFTPQRPPTNPFTPFSGNYSIVSPIYNSQRVPLVSIPKAYKDASFDLQEVYFGCAHYKNGTGQAGFCMLHVTGSKPGVADVTQDCPYEAWKNTMINCEFGRQWQGLHNITFSPAYSDPNTVVSIDNLKYVVHKRR